MKKRIIQYPGVSRGKWVSLTHWPEGVRRSNSGEDSYMERASWKEFPPVMSTCPFLPGYMPASSSFRISRGVCSAGRHPPSSAVWAEGTHWLSCENQVNLSTITLSIFFHNNSLFTFLCLLHVCVLLESIDSIVLSSFPRSPVKCLWEWREGRKWLHGHTIAVQGPGLYLQAALQVPAGAEEH